MTGHEVTLDMRIEDLPKYTLDELVTIARERGLIDGFAQKEGNGLEIRVDGTETILDHQEAIYFMRAVLQTWIIETGSLPPRTQQNGKA